MVYNTYTPSWDETFSFHLSDYSPTKPVEVNFTIMDWDQVRASSGGPRSLMLCSALCCRRERV